MQYIQDRQWHFMDVVFRGSVKACGDMEAALISLLKGIAGCYNIKPGREGISLSNPETCHCYIVYAAAGRGVGLGRARQLAADVPATRREGDLCEMVGHRCFQRADKKSKGMYACVYILRMHVCMCGNAW